MNYVEIELDGKTRKLRYDFNAIADVEEKAGAGITRLFGEDMVGLHVLRLLIWGGLKWNDRGLTIARVGDMLQKYLESGGELPVLSEVIQKALMVSGVLKAGEEGNGETGAAN